MQVSENIRKHSILVKEAQEKLGQVKSEYITEAVAKLNPVIGNFTNMIKSIPDKYAAESIKVQLIKKQQVGMIRIVQAKVLEKELSDWH